MRYWYLVASLPSLVLGAEPPLTPQTFRVLCGEHLAPGDLRELDAVLAGARGASPAARRCHDLEATIRAAAARWRAARLGLTLAIPRPDPVDLHLERLTGEALGRGTPLEREQALDRVRWQALESLAFGDPFGLAAILAYAQRLRLVARWAAFDVAEGERRMVAAVAVVDQQRGTA